LLLFIAEAVTGVLIGLLLRCVIGTAALAAQLVEQQLGLPGNPDTEDEHASTTLGRLYQLTATAVFFGLGGHCMVVAGLLDLAPNGALSITDALHELTDRTATLALASIALALRLAAPVVLALLTANLAVGMIARVMPQFAGPSVAAPVQMAVGLVLVLVSLAAITTGLFDQFGLIARGLIPRL
jgi:flagellar biosynthetic protein FliR